MTIDIRSAQGIDVAALLKSMGEPRRTVVVVAVHDDGRDDGRGLQRCLESVLTHTRSARVVVIDDASADPLATEVLDRLSALGRVELVRHRERAGRARTASEALELDPHADVALIDGGVEVGPGWLATLTRAAYGRARPAVAAALCVDEGDPERPGGAGLGSVGHLGWADVARAGVQSDLPFSLELAPGPAACALFPRAAMAGEGAAHVLAPRALVRRVVPGDGTVGSPPVPAGFLRDLGEDLRAQRAVRPRRLYVVSRPAGSPPPPIEDLSAFQDAYVLEIDGSGLELVRFTEAGRETLVAWAASAGARPRDHAEALALLAIDLGIELIQVQEFAEGPIAGVSEVARRLDIPFVLAAQDLVPTCPGTRPLVEAALAAAGAVVAPSRYAADLLAVCHPRHADAVRVIERPFDLAGLRPLRIHTARRPGPARIVAIAEWAESTGSEYLRAMAKHIGPSVEWHALGPGSEAVADFAVAHGAYEQGSLQRIVAELDPDLSAVVPLRPEAFSGVLAESWALGLPVLATDVGAVAEQVGRKGGGVLLPVDDPEAAAGRVAALVADHRALRNLRRQVPRPHAAQLAAAAESYLALYRDLERRPGRRHRLGYVMHGALGRHGGCKHVRVLSRLANPAISGYASARQVFIPEILAGEVLEDLDVLLVQRDGLCTDAAAALAAIRDSGVRLVVELDDDLLDETAARRMRLGPEAHAELRRRLTQVVRSADAVVVSTAPLGRLVGGLTRSRPVVVPNELDPRVWLRSVAPESAPKGREVRVLYMGTRTHLDDLLLLRPVIGGLAAAVGRPVVLEVVGVADSFDDDGWVRRLPLPRSAENYPDFVAWLRARRLRWSAAVAPLVDNGFNRCKSDLKLLEYALLDLPVVASDIGPYRGADDLAVLTSNDPGSWAEALVRCLRDRPAAAARAATAREHVLAHRMVTDAGVREWLAAVVGTPQI